MRRDRCLRLTVIAGVLALAGWGCRPAHANTGTGVPGWQDQDFNATTAGSASVDANGVWTIQGAGADTWERDDQFHIVYKPLKGDGSVTTKLLSAEEGNEWSKIGVMMRNDLTNKAASVMQLEMMTGHAGDAIIRGISDPQNGASSLQATRISRDEKMNVAPPEGFLFPRQFPMWMKLVRQGNLFTGYASSDGALWVPVTRSQKVIMGDQIIAGCFVCSHDEATLLTGTFDGKVTDVSNTLLKPEQAVPQQPYPVAITGGDNSVLLTWAPVDHFGHPADGYAVYRAKVGDTTFTKIADLTADKTSYLDTTIKNGNEALYEVTTIVKIGNTTLESRPFGPDPANSNLLLVETGAPNPPVKIGNASFFANVLDGGGDQQHTDTPGSAAMDANGVVTLQASGYALQNREDGGEELLTPVHGDFTFTARVLGLPTNVDGSGPNEEAKFGIAVRENTLAESRYASMVITPQHGIRSPHYRMTTTGWTEDAGPNENTPTFPIYFRIQRQGDTLKFFTSADGSTFKAYGDPDTLTMPSLNTDVYAGFIGSSDDNTTVSQAKFDKIQLTTP